MDPTNQPEQRVSLPKREGLRALVTASEEILLPKFERLDPRIELGTVLSTHEIESVSNQWAESDGFAKWPEDLTMYDGLRRGELPFSRSAGVSPPELNRDDRMWGVLKWGDICSSLADQWGTEASLRRAAPKSAVVVGPGGSADNVVALLRAFPTLESLHVVDVSAFLLARVGAEFSGSQGILQDSTARIILHRASVLSLPTECWKADIVCDRAVFDPTFFDASQLKQAENEILKALEPGGVHVTVHPFPLFHTSELFARGIQLDPARMAWAHPRLSAASQRADSESPKGAV